MFECMECGKSFRSVRIAERAAMNGCPKCGAVDIDLAYDPPEPVRCPDDPYDVDVAFDRLAEQFNHVPTYQLARSDDGRWSFEALAYIDVTDDGEPPF